jgi:atypical dual specificity phosphatase
LPAFSFTWIEQGTLGACSAPAFDGDYAELRRNGITLLVNLHDDPHDPSTLKRFGIEELHLPVTDFRPPTRDQISKALSAIEDARGTGEGAAVHCMFGLGRTGTVVACWLVAQGITADAAIERVRELRPGSVETPEQVAAVRSFARGRRT